MLTARVPFGGDGGDRAVMGRIRRGQYSLPVEASQEVRDLLQRMLEPKPGRRATMAQVLAHPWVRAGLHTTGTFFPKGDLKNTIEQFLN